MAVGVGRILVELAPHSAAACYVLTRSKRGPKRRAIEHDSATRDKTKAMKEDADSDNKKNTWVEQARRDARIMERKRHTS